ncbi:MAG: hypothetical protein GKS05_05200 [Nitrospirales bacterium]|nr:hypothetical protein [Nitrospirales bacterium]
MRYVLMAIAGLWITDGIALLIAPAKMMELLNMALRTSSGLLHWSGLTGLLGILLFIGADELSYQPLWTLLSLIMMIKSLALLIAPDHIRQPIIAWVLKREPIDYRIWGIGLCVLSVLLLDATGLMKGVAP